MHGRGLHELPDNTTFCGQATYPDFKVQAPSAKQLKALPQGVRLTSPAAHAVTSIARKQEPTQAPSLQAADVAEALAASFNALRAAAPQACCSCSAVAAQGHINFVMEPTSMQACATPTITSPKKRQRQQQQQEQQTHAQQQQQQQPPQLEQEQQRRQAHVKQQQQQQQQQPVQSFNHGAADVDAQRRGSHAAATSSAPAAHTAGAPHTFEIRVVPSIFIKEEFDLYCKYQVWCRAKQSQVVLLLPILELAALCPSPGNNRTRQHNIAGCTTAFLCAWHWARSVAL